MTIKIYSGHQYHGDRGEQFHSPEIRDLLKLETYYRS